MRLAWIGPAPTEGGGVAYAETQLLKALAAAGVEVDCFVAVAEEAVPESLRSTRGLRFFCRPARWQSGRWYSRTSLTKFLTGQTARALAQAPLGALVARRHAERPYDFLYQFSQTELLGLRPLLKRLPPLVLHPEVHAAGELRWHRREAALARRGESLGMHLVVRAMLVSRAFSQRRDMRKASLVMAPSQRFADHLAADYGISPDRLRVVPNPIDLDRFAPLPGGDAHGGPVTLLFVSRMSVRKGLELVVDLSHRLADLKGQVHVVLVGDRTLWSDYRPLLADLEPDIATYHGPSAAAGLNRLYALADGLIQPAHYEPFALTVGEALASGLYVVVSDEVGAREGVGAEYCRVFPAGDAAAFEGRVRDLVGELRADRDLTPSAGARDEAERLFSPAVVVQTIIAHLSGTPVEAPADRVHA